MFNFPILVTSPWKRLDEFDHVAESLSDLDVQFGLQINAGFLGTFYGENGEETGSRDAVDFSFDEAIAARWFSEHPEVRNYDFVVLDLERPLRLKITNWTAVERITEYMVGYGLIKKHTEPDRRTSMPGSIYGIPQVGNGQRRQWELLTPMLDFRCSSAYPRDRAQQARYDKMRERKQHQREQALFSGQDIVVLTNGIDGETGQPAASRHIAYEVAEAYSDVVGWWLPYFYLETPEAIQFQINEIRSVYNQVSHGELLS